MKSITVNDWIEAERELKNSQAEPQPKGSVTVEQYSKIIGKSPERARAKLAMLRKQGFATSRSWKNGERGHVNIFFLKPKSEWPTSK